MALAEARRGDATSLTEKLRDFSAKYVKISDLNKTRTRTLVNDYIENQIIEFCRQKSELQILNLQYTGSFYERLKTEAADEVDIMVVLGTPSSEIEVIASEVPGYVRLRAKGNPIFCKYLGHEGYLDPGSFRDRWFRSIVQRAVNNIKPKAPFSDVRLVVRTHGPAVQVDIFRKGSKEKLLSVDLVPCFHARDSWYVPRPFKGKRFVFTHKGFWSQSFSLEEKQVLENMDQKDQKDHGCRHELLRIVKTVIKGQVTSLPLDSYYLKTAFMHYIEKHSQDWVNKEALGKHFLGYLGEVLLYLESGNLPHYNLPDVNLLNDFNEVAVKQMANRLKRILNSEVRLQKILV